MSTTATTIEDGAIPGPQSHRRWVRICHWTIAASFLTLAVTGVLILMVHPRLYLGEVGNDLTPALLTLPISNNHRPDEMQRTIAFEQVPGSPVTAERNFAIFNQNGWGRSLHFLAAWILVVTGAIYSLLGIAGGHVWRDLIPSAGQLTPRALWRDLKDHMHMDGQTGAGLPYGLLQKLAYTLVVFIALPLMVISGLTMSPTMTAAFPFLLDLFGGYQSARTAHFFVFTALVLFLVVHLAMVVATGLRRQLRAMVMGK